MVGWYDPSVFLLTGIETLISTIFGERSDFRQIEALSTPSVENDQVYLDSQSPLQSSTEQYYYDFRYHYSLKEECEPDENGRKNWYEQDRNGRFVIDRSKPRDEISIDYVADTGDGWDSTYAVAYYLTLPHLDFAVPPAEDGHTKRGEILIFGGDQVYPMASRKDYQERLVKPYESVLPETDRAHPFLFVTPGNHDWYDSLVSFSRLFCSRDWFAGWLTRQSRSYFALRLPHNWWFIGVDVQLSSDLDGAQIKFFKRVRKEMEDGDRIILGVPEPHWIHTELRPDYKENFGESYLKDLEEKVFGSRVKVRVFLAGDLHHYRRHEAPDKTQKITAGGGGAFLHPTHSGRLGVNFDEIADTDRNGNKKTFTRKGTFPDPRISKRLCWRNLYFAKTNWRFGLLTAATYWLTSWVLVPIANRNLNPFIFSKFFSEMFPNPAVAFWLALTFVAMVAFTNTHSRVYRFVAGGLHGFSHFLAAVLLSFFSCWLVHRAGVFRPRLSEFYFNLCDSGLCRSVEPAIKLLVKHTSIAFLIALGALIVGPFLMGLYLLPSLNFFGRHYNEAFAALRTPDWKNFLRLKIDRKGDLIIYPIGIERVPRHWRAAGTSGAQHPTAKYEPDDKTTPPRLIEDPIRVEP